MRAKTLDEFLGLFCPDKPQPFKIPDSDSQTVGVIYRGSVHNLSLYGDSFNVDDRLPEGFEEIPDFQDGHFRIVWKCDALRAIVTYCEGDITVTIDRTLEFYQERLLSAAVFYQTH